MGIEHRYGANLHVSDSVWMQTLLARIGSPETAIQEVPDLVRAAYGQQFAEILTREFPTAIGRIATRMVADQPERAFYEGPLLDPHTRLVVVAVVRGGILPAQTCYDQACRVLPPANVRLDFLTMSRATDAAGHVTGVRFEGSKIGGPVHDAVVIIPDPMGATGGTIARAVETYQNLAGGQPRCIVSAQLMVTPEAVQRLTGAFPSLRIYAGRLDRGMSDADVLRSVPGTFPDRERGLNDNQYIVPGAGGIGELLTNSWV